jgi:hypothetical protein
VTGDPASTRVIDYHIERLAALDFVGIAALDGRM